MIREPNTVPIPAPDPAIPTVAAPAPMNLAAESISLDTADVWNPLTALTKLPLAIMALGVCWFCVLGPFETMLLIGLTMDALELERIAERTAGATALAKEYMFVCCRFVVG